MAELLFSRRWAVLLTSLLFVLTACSSASPTASPIPSVTKAAAIVQLPSSTPQPTSTLTSTSTATATITPSPTPSPTPAGGGGLIAFSSIRPGSKFASPKSDIVLLNPNGGALTWLTGDSLNAFRDNPAWSPEGNKLVFNQDNLLYTVDISAGEEQELETPFGSGIYHPSWSANNQLLFLYFAQKQYPQIWFAPEDTLEWKEFTPELAFQYDPVWAPDGRTYAFAGAPGTIKSQWYKTVFGGLTLTFYDIQPRDIYLVDVEGGQTTQLTSGREDEFHPAWSPDGQTLAFVSILDAKNPEIFTIKRDGSDLTRVTRNPAQEVHPSWSPDGSMIAFASDRDGNFEIYVTDTYGLLTTRMTANMMDDFQPVWSSAQTISPDQESLGQGASGDVWSFVPKRLKMEDLVNWLYKAGLVSTAKGRNEKLVGFKEEWAQINWYEYYLTGFSPGDFVVRTDARWETDSDKANWFSSGCGFVFREKDVDNHYMVHLGMDGIVYLSRYKNGAYSPIGRSSVRYPLETPADGANLMLAVEGDNIHFFVNGLLMLSEKDKSFQEGNLAYTLNSGTNKGFGTRCQMDNVELWTLKK